MLLRYLLLGIFLFVFTLSQAQNNVEILARAELEKRGLDEGRLREELLKRGVDLNNIDPNNKQQILANEKTIREVIEMLEKEKNQKSGGTGSTTPGEPPATPVSQERRSVDEAALDNQSQDIQKAVKEGATIEEAISEKIQESAKEKLPGATTYGQHIFRDKSIKLYRTSEDAKPSKSYVLGPGDKIAISIWGPTQENFALEIEKDGYIQPTGLPRYYIAGLTLGQAENLMASKLKNYYYFQKENFELTVTTARTINVNIYGEVFTNGTFNISAINTAFNALIASGGPTNLGSVRKIQVTRPGQKPKNLDVYLYLNNPSITQDFYLNENDFIFVPIAEKLVTISGEVNRPYKYELINNENLNDLLKFAGGLTVNALKSNIKIKRIEDDSVRIIDLNLTQLEKSGKNFEVRNGDEIQILNIDNLVKNSVYIEGAVENPGEFALNTGDDISGLLKKSRLKENAVLDLAYLKRFNDDLKTIRYEFVNIGEILRNPQSAENKKLLRGDNLIIVSKELFVDKYKVSIEGAVRQPITIDLDKKSNMKISDLVFLSGGLQEYATDFAYIFRKDIEENNAPEYVYVNIKEALENPSSESNILLEPNDRLIIYSKYNYIDGSFITVGGAVRKPGDFPFHPSLNLKDVLLLANGLKQEAALDRVDIYRLDLTNNKSTRVLVAKLKLDAELNVVGGDDDFELEPFDQVFVRYAPEFELQRNILISGEIKYPGTYALTSYNMRIATLIKDAGGPTNESFLSGATLLRKKDNVGYIIFDLEHALKLKSNKDNIILQEGDEIFIPKRNDLVTITGATNTYEWYPQKVAELGRINVQYSKNKNVMYYINEYAGGLSKNASKAKISVIDASGKVHKTKRFLFFQTYPKVKPGSTINVGYKTVKPKEEKGKNEEDVKWGEVLANSIAQATAILSIILLIQNVN
ncbi:MAG: SLBB domain-containing protein [Saprospiraceae bacterium]|nr:SLBB domain-containing protein [Saprospiraceae bacterium]MBK9042467.1 SLBB domain-containing protein [Saprospiraceae bacterium]